METTAPPELVITHRSTVTEEQIDHLGHMNVRFYGVNAHAGTRSLLSGLGVTVEAGVVDAYTRHHREQLAGARLAVHSGVIGLTPDGLRIYHELRNTETGVVAATFVHRVVLPEHEVERVASVAPPTVEIPAYGAPRSIAIDTDPVAAAPSLAALRAADLAIRKERLVTVEECDAEGAYLPTMAAALVWGGEPVEERFPALLHEGPNGERMGWASMETRIVMPQLPRVGDRIQSFSAVVALGDKVMQNAMWAFDVELEHLLTTFEVVNLAFDVGTRRPMRIPDRIRAAEEELLHPEFASRRPDAGEGA
jgi:acyl-CoA thioesterase FadM